MKNVDYMKYLEVFVVMHIYIYIYSVAGINIA